jgi:DNA-binding LacI/PurR family transcriptional regulator
VSPAASAPRRAGTRPRRPGGTDVARLAGVSQKTVSRVMNGEAYVSDEVRERVLRAAADLGYRRNNLARALNSGRTNRIGVVSLGTALFGPSSLLMAIERAARSSGFTLTLANTLEGEPGGIDKAINSLMEEGVDGIILSEPIDEGPQNIAIDVPVLNLGRFPGLSAPQIIAPVGKSERSGYTATSYLLSLGHREIRHLAGPQRWWAARDRLEGWRRAMNEAHLPQAPCLAGDWSPSSGYKAGLELAQDREMTAIFVANDDMAIGVIRAFSEAGRDVPGDVSVIGMDDIPQAAFINPPLTTIAQEFDVVATRGFRQLVAQIEGEQLEEDDDREPFRLVVRQSTAALDPRA